MKIALLASVERSDAGREYCSAKRFVQSVIQHVTALRREATMTAAQALHFLASRLTRYDT